MTHLKRTLLTHY